jgi:predicted RNA-binding protein with PUA-like domain
VVGIAEIVKENFPDPKDAAWTSVEIKPKRALKAMVTLAQIKANKKLAAMVLVKNSRLSVQPVKVEEFDLIIAMSEE